MSAFNRFGCVALALLVTAACNKAPQGRFAESDAGVATQAASSQPVARALAYHAFASLPDRGELLAYANRDQDVRRDGAYTWHRANLSESYALRSIGDGHLRLTTPSGVLLDVHYDRHVEHDSGDWTWVGHVAGHPEQQTILTFGPHAAFGSIAQPDGLPLRLTVRNGVSWLVETDPRMIAGIHNAATRPQRPDFLVPPATHGGPGNIPGTMSMASAPATAVAAATASATTVDLVVGYTPGFASDNGGDSGALTHLNFLVDVANTAYVNSAIDAKVRLVHAMQVAYTDASSNSDTLEKLTGYNSTSNQKTTPDPAFNALRAARDQYGADLVSMVRSYRDPENDGCGIAWLIGGGRQAITSGDSYYGYSVVSDGTDQGTDGKTYYCLDETLAHEMGHNMGAAHDVETAKGDNGTLEDDEYGAYTYSFGYKTTASTGNFYTIMAYGDSGQTIYRIFSDPRSTFCGGRACGDAANADNARTLSQTIPTIAAFRAAAVAMGPASVHNDVSGDGKSELLFRNASLQLVGWWEMDGTRVIATHSQAAGGDYRLGATGDFNGDGKADLAWTNSARTLVLFTSNGPGFTSATVSSDFGAGWSLVGAGDINGDGKADLIFRNAAAQLVGWWEMDGSSVLATRSQAAGGGYNVSATGDFNGDGKTDIAWTNSARRLVLFTSTGTGFTSFTLSNDFGAGWSLVDAGDINGDGKSDLIFRNAAAQLVGWWEMNGTGVLATRSQGAGSSYTLSATGDFNGDGKADLAWTNSVRRLVLFTSTGTAFTSYTLSNDFGAGWSVQD